MINDVRLPWKRNVSRRPGVDWDCAVVYELNIAAFLPF